MFEKIIKVTPIIKRVNSIYGNFAIPVLREYTYDNGKKQRINGGKYFFRKVEAVKWLESNKNIKKDKR